MKKKEYEFKEIEVIELEVTDSSDEEESSLLLRAYARIPVTDGGCGADGGSDGGPPYCQ